MDKYTSTLLPQDDTKEENQKATLDLLAKINAVVDDVNSQIATTITTLQNSLVPIGFTYTQLPGMSAPATLWPFGTWTDISASYAGAFFRAEGGAASAFGAGSQADAMQGHWHNFRKYNSTANVGWTTNYAAFSDQTGSGIGFATANIDNQVSVQSPINDGVNGVPRTASETRPLNYTVRIWRRTA